MMKKDFYRSVLSILLILTGLPLVVRAQTLDFSAPIPFDTTIKKGVLPNGITYFIKYNKRPEKRADLRLVINAGSILEDPDQVGLAHFTEHMTFNGTKRFPKNQLVSYLQSMGIRFGPEINAYTGFDETVYMLEVPTDNKELMEKSIQILEDWAHQVTFDSLEVEKERGVVIEEWRLGRGADQRLEDKYLPLLFYNSRYAQRLPIGTKENLETFRHASLKRFYADWYRPDLMAVVAVGDFDTRWVEQKIVKYFSAISLPKTRRERIVYDIPPHKTTLYGVFTDKEATNTTVAIFYKHPFEKEKTIGEYRNSLLRMLYFQMVNERLAEKLRQPNPPYLQAYSYFGNIGARKTYAYVSVALANENEADRTLIALLTENERLKKYGFSESELERAKLNVLKMYEQYYNEREKTESDNFASELTRHFLQGEPVPGIAAEYQIVKESLPGIKLEEINALPDRWLTDSNRVVIITAPEKAGKTLPDTLQLKELVENFRSDTIAPNVDMQVNQNLLTQLPQKGKVVSLKKYKKVDVTEILLSNGARVLLKPTSFKNDEILLQAVSPGGHFLYHDTDAMSAKYCVNIVQESGVGQFSVIELQKALAGKNVSISPYITEYMEGMRANASLKDLKTMFELMYLYFTQPRLDTTAVSSWLMRMKAYFANVMADPTSYYLDQLNRIVTQNHPRANRIPQPEMIDKINPARAFSIYRERFANAADFNFIIVGNFLVDSIVPLIEQYIGSLPALKNREKWNDLGIRPPLKVKENVYKGSDPKSITTLIFTGPMNYSYNNAYHLKALEEYLDIRLIEVLREEKSGVYGVGARSMLERIPYSYYQVSFRIPCAPGNVDSLVNETLNIIAEIKNKGITDDYLKKIKETHLRELEVNLEKNNFWLNYLQNTVIYTDDIDRIETRRKQIETLNSIDIQRIAKKVFTDKYIWVTLYPEK
ncbi:MAG: M16 family metallopeptidase [Bacteroidales bacterium]